MPNPLYGNTLLEARANSLAAIFNGLSTLYTLRLFQNIFLPTPATPLSSFVQSTFPGYAPIGLAGSFGSAVRVQDGQWEISSPIFGFGNTGSSSATVQGWYIDDGTNMVACQAFTTPVTITAGGTYTFQLRPQEISQSIL